MANPSPNVGYSSFDLSHSKKTLLSFGQLVPILCEECVPGDVFRLGGQFVINSLPTVDQVKHRCFVDVYYYYVPTRILDDAFEDFIRGGLHGTTISSATTPKWFFDYSDHNKYPDETISELALSNSLWFQFGLPAMSLAQWSNLKSLNDGKFMPVDYPRRAYNLIYFYYYTAHIFDLANEAKFNSDNPLWKNDNVLKANWYNDYFTTAIPYRQRGALATIGLSVNPNAKSSYSYKFGRSFDDGAPLTAIPVDIMPGAEAQVGFGVGSLAGFTPMLMQGSHLHRGLIKYEGVSHNLPNTSDTSVLTLTPREQIPTGSFSVDDLRTAILLQQYMELNTRNAEFYSDFILKNFGVSSGDARFQKPEYIGSIHTDLFFNEITNLAETSSGRKLGERISIGRAASGDYVAKFRAPEFGYIIGLLCVRPRNEYFGGIPRFLLRHVCTDFYVPSFAHMPFQEVYVCELSARGNSSINEVFGYQGRYDEMRSHFDYATYPFLKLYGQQTYTRLMSDTPRLGKDFLRCDVQNNNFIVQTVPQFTLEFYHNIRATRPMPQYSQPLSFGL